MPELTITPPKSRSEIAETQRRRLAIAVSRAKSTPFYAGKLDHIDCKKLDDPEHWRKIPILDKEHLRALSDENFYSRFCDSKVPDIQQYWRSGGSTGRPLFYPRSSEDLKYAIVGFQRVFACSQTKAGHKAHHSFPLGIHPAGHLFARAGEDCGIAMAWVGAGNSAPSSLQLELIEKLKPTLWMGMSSYGQHLANLSDANGTPLNTSSVERIICTAEPLTQSKRAKLERSWGAEVFDSYGMTECTMMGAESPAHDGFHIWTDLAHIEVLDEETLTPVPEGTPGLLVITPLYTNHVTPFLRWNTGDIVTYHDEGSWDGPFSVFPIVRHAHRTAGFFKFRGVNINHTEFEDFMFAIDDVNEFKAELITENGEDAFILSIETRHGSQEAAVVATVARAVKSTFEITPDVRVRERGTLVAEFERTVKPQRFIDSRS